MLVITDPAAEMLAQIIQENEADGLQASLEQSCCHTSPVFHLVRFEENDAPVDIHGIKVLMDEETEQFCDDAIVDVQDGELMVFRPSQSGCDCGSHDHEGGCCGSEGGCCSH